MTAWLDPARTRGGMAAAILLLGLTAPAALAQANPPAGPGGALTGRVVTPEGSPVGGAVVSWIRRGDREPTVVATARTGTDGAFRFDPAEPARPGEPPPQLLVEAAGWGLAFQPVPPGSEPQAITVEPATELRVPFIDAAGRPVAGLAVAPVVVAAPGLIGGRRGFRNLFLPAAVRARLERRTDERGMLTLPELPRGGRVRLDPRDERFAQLGGSEPVQLGAEAVTEARSIRLLPGASLAGRVTFGPTGKPAAGIRVGAQSADGWGEAVTDAEGRYHITRLRVGAYNVATDLDAELAREWTARAHERVPLAAGERAAGRDLTLIPGALLAGKVTATDNGEPVAGLRIGVYGPARPRSGAWVQSVPTGADGRFALRVPPGEQYVYLQSEPPEGFLRTAVAERTLTVRDGETATVDFALRRVGRARPVRGRVLGPDGQPAAGATVLAFCPGRGDQAVAVTASAQGGFTLDALLAARAPVLRARHGDLATPGGVAAVGGEEVTLRLQAHALGQLEGTVTNASGGPLRGAEVLLFEWAYDSGMETARAATDAAGHYRFDGLWPDLRYSVRATAEGHGQKYGEQRGLTPGETVRIEPLALKKADRWLAGRVVDERGDPVAGVTVSAHGRDSRDIRATTDRAGRFRIEPVVEEQIQLTASGPGERVVEKSVAAGTEDAILVLPGRPADAAPARGVPDPVAAYDREKVAAMVGRPAPSLRAIAWVNSEPLTLERLRGKVVLLDFWGVGCGPCVAALPAVQRLAEQFGGKGVVAIGVHDSGIDREALRRFAAEHRLTYPLAIDAEDEGLSFGKTFTAYTVRGIPTVAVIDREGRLVSVANSLGDAVAALGPLLSTGGP